VEVLGISPITVEMWKKRLVQMPSNRFEVLRDRVMHRGEGSKKEKGKDRKIILKEKRAKRGVEVQ